MRLSACVPLLAILFFATRFASAQGAPNGNGNNSLSSIDPDEDEDDAAEHAKSYAARKSWMVGSSFETNRTLQQEEVGVGQKAFNTLSLYAGYNITKKDSVRVNGGFIQRFIADATETGIRADDIGLTYSHRLHLPWHLLLAPSVSNAIPISFRSRLMGLIALPRASVGLSRGFLDNNLQASLRGGGAYYIVEYTSAKGLSDANPRASINTSASLGYSMPFHQALQVGFNVGTNFSWDYNVEHANDPTLREQFPTTPVEPSQDPYFAGRPTGQQSYFWEGYVSYNLPSLIDIRSQLQVAISQGDGVLREGATHLLLALPPGEPGLRPAQRPVLTSSDRATDAVGRAGSFLVRWKEGRRSRPD